MYVDFHLHISKYNFYNALHCRKPSDCWTVSCQKTASAFRKRQPLLQEHEDTQHKGSLLHTDRHHSPRVSTALNTSGAWRCGSNLSED